MEGWDFLFFVALLRFNLAFHPLFEFSYLISDFFKLLLFLTSLQLIFILSFRFLIQSLLFFILLLYLFRFFLYDFCWYLILWFCVFGYRWFCLFKCANYSSLFDYGKLFFLKRQNILMFLLQSLFEWWGFLLLYLFFLFFFLFLKVSERRFYQFEF